MYLFPEQRPLFFSIFLYINHMKMALDGLFSGDKSRLIELPLGSSNDYGTCWTEVNASLTKKELENMETSFLYSEDPSVSIAAGIYLVIKCIAGAVFNSIVLLVLLKNKDLRMDYLTPSIVSMSIADFLFSIIVIPSVSYVYFTGEVLISSCGAKGFISYGLWFCSALHLLGMSVLRCVLIHHPMTRNETPFRRACIVAPLMSWFIGFLFWIPTLVRKHGSYVLLCRSMICNAINVDSDNKTIDIGPTTTTPIVFVMIGIAIFLLNISTYFRVSKMSRAVIKQIENIDCDAARNLSDREKEVGKWITIITLSFFLTYCIIPVCRIMDPLIFMKNSYVVVVVLLINCSRVIINPLVYMICRTKYRDAMKKFLKYS